MSEKFERLDEERKDRVLNAAMREFAIKGYEDASTNIIAKDSGLSKSLMLHYVGSKRELFLIAYDIAIQTIIENFFGSIDLTQKDLLERCKQISFVKIELLHRFPQVFDFFKAAIDTTSEEVRPELNKRNQSIRTITFDKLFEDVDTNLFREDIDSAKAIKLIVWFMNGLGDDMQSQVVNLKLEEIDYDKLMSQSNEFFAIIRNCFYKQN